MTAEIVIMNSQAVALAADSAVTVSRGLDQKIFSSANKLFALSKNHDIGVMVYGNSNFMTIPWETIIKLYREKVSKVKFSSIKKCVDDFLIYLAGCNKLISPSSEKRIYKETISSFFGFVKSDYLKELDSTIKSKGKVTQEEVAIILDRTINKMADRFKSEADSPCIKEGFREYIRDNYKDVTEELIKKVFEKLPLSQNNIDNLKQMSVDLCCKFPKDLRSPSESGVVIAGFGDEEIFPVLKSFVVEFTFNGMLKYKLAKEGSITDNLGSTITPFAQGDVVATFMNGIDPERDRIERGFLGELFKEYQDEVLKGVEGLGEEQKESLKEKLRKIGEEKTKEHGNKMAILTQSRYVLPVMNVIRVLPKDELAKVAETFINLTSFKKRVTMESETVGGPIDVAVISKGDGFIWIKRKHYFDKELNPQFFARYEGGLKNDIRTANRENV